MSEHLPEIQRTIENEVNEPVEHHLGRKAYNAYRMSTNYVSAVTGDELPPWDGLALEVQRAWGAAANAVVVEVVFRIEERTRFGVGRHFSLSNARNADLTDLPESTRGD